MRLGTFNWRSRLGIAVIAIGIAGCAQFAAHDNDNRNEKIIAATSTEGATLPVTTAGNAGGIVDGVPVVAGGSSWSRDKTTKSWLRDCFSFQHGKWVAGPSLPNPLSDPAYASDGKTLYVVAGTEGKHPTTAAMMLSRLSDGWKPLPPLPVAVEGAAAVTLDHRLYVFGGFTAERATNDLWMLDLHSADSAWKKLASLPADGRGFPALTTLGSQVYLFGGFTSPPYTKTEKIFDDVFRYDPASDQWTRLPADAFPGYGWTAATVSQTEILLAGRVAEFSHTSDDLWLFDTGTNQFRMVGKLVTPNCCAPLIPLGGKTWIYAGGEPDTNRSRSNRTSIIKLQSAEK